LKWFRHMTHARRDPVIAEAMQLFGNNGYAVYFIILELIGENYSVESPGKLKISWTQVQLESHLRRTSLKRILSFYSEKSKFSFNYDDTYVWINCPKFKEFTDDYYQRLLNKKYVHEKTDIRIRENQCTDRTEQNKKNKESNTNEVVKETVPESGHGPSSVGDILRFWRR